MNHIEEINEIEKDVLAVVKNSEIIVQDSISMEIASEIVLEFDSKRKRVVEYWADAKKRAHEAWKGIVAKEKEMLDPIDEARESLKKKINAYLTEQKRKEDEERRRLEAERRAKEEEERVRLEAERKAAEEEAKKLEAEGKAEEAEAKKAEIEMIQDAEQNVFIPAEVPEEAMQKTTRMDSGTVSGKTEIEIEIRDKKAVLEAMIKDGLLDSIKISETELKKYIKLKGLKSYPGCGIKEVVNASFRGKRSA